MAAPADLGYVFLVTYGRSGSTLLQAVLNAIPGYLVRGENRQALRHLWAFHATLADERKRVRREQRREDREPGTSTSSDPFFGVDGFPVQRSLREIRRLVVDTVLRPEPATRVTGFKEIRWYAEDTPDFVAWLREVFPGARFIINTRDLDDVARSKWWAQDPEAHSKLARIERDLLALAESCGEAAFHVHYDDYVADPAALEPLFAWLGETYDETTVRAVLDRPHSY